tara:strand:+ start:3829 stop:4326 length:498 start_codon:yes stop_codon:yes gene_type:complete
MNPLIPTEAIQIRYDSPIYEPYYDDEDNIIDEECVEPGTDVVRQVISKVHNDGIPRYYRLRHRHNARDHKNRWNKWIQSNLMGQTHYFVAVSIIGRRVLFSYAPKLSIKREKLFKSRDFKAKQRKRIQERDRAQQAAAPEEYTWEHYTLHKQLEVMLGERMNDER